MHEHLTKCLSKITKKQKVKCHICQLLGEIVLVIQKFIVMSEKVGSWHGIKADILRITYSILCTNSKISIGIFYIRPTSSDDTYLIIARL